MIDNMFGDVFLPAEEWLPCQNDPLSWDESEPSGDGKQDRKAEPVSREGRKAVEPGLKFATHGGNTWWMSCEL